MASFEREARLVSTRDVSLAAPGIVPGAEQTPTHRLELPVSLESPSELQDRAGGSRCPEVEGSRQKELC